MIERCAAATIGPVRFVAQITLLAVLGCGRAELSHLDTTTSCEGLVARQVDPIHRMEVLDERVYWADMSVLWSVPSCGGDVQEVDYPGRNVDVVDATLFWTSFEGAHFLTRDVETSLPLDDWPSSAAYDGDAVYFRPQLGDIASARREDGRTNVRWLSDDPGDVVGVDDRFVYLGDRAKLKRVPKAGGDVEAIREVEPSDLVERWIIGPGVALRPRNTCPRTTCSSFQPIVPDEFIAHLDRVDLSDGTTRTLLALERDVIFDVVVRGSRIYVATAKQVLTIEADGSTRTILDRGAGVIAVEDDALYTTAPQLSDTLVPVDIVRHSLR